MSRGKPQAFELVNNDGTTRLIAPRGRDAWALEELIRVGAKGLTTLERPAPRWSGYIHKLKRIYGVNIETVPEGHGGEFAGRHGRYILRSTVRVAA